MVRCRTAAEKCAIIHLNKTGQQTIVRDDDVVSDPAIVAYVGSSHQKILVAEFRRASFRRAAMNGAVLADNVVVADLNFGCSLGRKRNILWRGADHRAVANEITVTNLNFSFDDDVRLNDRFVSDHYLRSNPGKRSDFYIIFDSRSRIDNRSGMNLRGAHLVSD